MNSRERILNSIKHKETDKVPIDLGGTSVTGISAIAYNKLKDKLGISSPSRVYDVVQQLAMVDWEFIESFGIDVLDINRLFMDDIGWHKVTLGDGSVAAYPDWFRPETDDHSDQIVMDHYGRVMARMPQGGMCFDQACFPWEKGYPKILDNIAESFKSINWVAHSHTNYINIDSDDLRNRTRQLRESSDKAITMSGGAKLLEMGFFLRRMDNFLMDLLMDPQNVSGLLDKLVDIHLSQLEKKL